MRRQKAATEGNNPGEEEDEEAQLQRAMDLSRAEAEYRRGWNREDYCICMHDYDYGICMHAYYYCISMHDYKLLLWCDLLH